MSEQNGNAALPAVRAVAAALPLPEELKALESPVLYKLELLGGASRDVLNERIVDWTQRGWSQREIAAEVGCDHSTIARRQQRLGVKAAGPQAGLTAPNADVAPRNIGRTVAPRNSGEVEEVTGVVVPAEEVREARQALTSPASNPDEEGSMSPPPSAPAIGDHWTVRARRLGSALHDLAESRGGDEEALEVARAEWRPVEAALKSAARKAA